MKGAYFFTVILFLLQCLSSNAQDRGNNTEIKPTEKAIKSMLPPQLAYPSNESVIEEKYPVLIWIAPCPTNGMMVLYSLRLVEVMQGQTPAEALQQNPALLNMSGLSNTFLNYPLDAVPLRANSHYAWQVAASYAGQSMGVTDIWVFSLKDDKNKNSPAMEYPVASKVSKERFYVTNGVFHFVYNNSADENTLSYTIKSMDKSGQNLTGLPIIKLNPGMNKLQIDLQQSGKLKNETYYYLEIRDNRQQVYKLMYYYIES